jgi:hypothetical protein
VGGNRHIRLHFLLHRKLWLHHLTYRARLGCSILHTQRYNIKFFRVESCRWRSPTDGTTCRQMKQVNFEPSFHFDILHFLDYRKGSAQEESPSHYCDSLSLPLGSIYTNSCLHTTSFSEFPVNSHRTNKCTAHNVDHFDTF